jgi:hypothetical protein
MSRLAGNSTDKPQRAGFAPSVRPDREDDDDAASGGRRPSSGSSDRAAGRVAPGHGSARSNGPGGGPVMAAV